jgi:hypothetical protein
MRVRCSAAARGFAPWREAASGVLPARGRYLFSLPVLIAVLTAPLVGHGCHGDDVDHEPSAAPPLRAVAVHVADPKTSR